MTLEWLEADGRGGFASGTADLVRTRRYHALLLSAAKPPTERFVLVNGIEALVVTPRGRFAISSQQYGGGVVFPDGRSRVEEFRDEPWPRWVFRLEDGTRIEQEVLVSRRTGATRIGFSALGAEERGRIVLDVRLLMSGRDYHSLHHENDAFRFEPEERDGSRIWRPYSGVPSVAVRSNGEYRQDPLWFRNFFYSEESARGLEATEDLASPGHFQFDLSAGDAFLVLEAVPEEPGAHRNGAASWLSASRSAPGEATWCDNSWSKAWSSPSPVL